MNPMDIVVLGGMLAAWFTVLSVPMVVAVAADSRHSHLGDKADLESRATASVRARTIDRRDRRLARSCGARRVSTA